MNTLEKITVSISRLLSEEQRPIILLTGPSGSGKTSLARQMQDTIPSVIVSIDWWLIKESPRRHAEVIEYDKIHGTFPSPLEWYDWKDFREKVLSLQKTGHLHLEKAWDQESGLKTRTIDITAPDRCAIIAEGMYMNEVQDIAALTIMIDCDIEKSHAITRIRQKKRTSDDYLDVKHKWHVGFDVPYFAQHANQADYHIPSFLEK